MAQSRNWNDVHAVVGRPQVKLTIVALAVAMVLPFVVKNFIMFQLTLAMIYGIAILGLNLLTGFNGQFSLGHSAFFALGAYTAAIMMNTSIAYYWTLPAAGLVCLVFGFLFGLPALRLEGVYLALATFSLANPRRKSSNRPHWSRGPAACKASSSYNRTHHLGCRCRLTNGSIF